MHAPRKWARCSVGGSDQRTIYNFGHVNAQVRIDGRTGTVDLDASVLMDRRGPKVISDERLFAHYYNNRGSELMAASQNTESRVYYEQALKMDASLPNIWNNIGVLDAREGDLKAAAAAAYAQALRLNPAHAATLSNSVNLYRRLGDNAGADAMLRQLSKSAQSIRSTSSCSAARPRARVITTAPSAITGVRWTCTPVRTNSTSDWPGVFPDGQQPSGRT